MVRAEANAEKTKQIRLAVGLTQKELAIRAGVSERTIRNIESGRRVRKDFLQYVAATLGVGLLDLVQHPERFKLGEKLIDRILHAQTTFFENGDFVELSDILKPTVRWEVDGPVNIPIYGDFHGAVAVERLLNEVCAPLLQYRTEPPQFDSIQFGDSFVVIHATDSGLVSPAGKVCETYRCTQIIDLDCERIARYRLLGGVDKIVRAFQ